MSALGVRPRGGGGPGAGGAGGGVPAVSALAVSAVPGLAVTALVVALLVVALLVVTLLVEAGLAVTNRLSVGAGGPARLAVPGLAVPRLAGLAESRRRWRRRRRHCLRRVLAFRLAGLTSTGFPRCPCVRLLAVAALLVLHLIILCARARQLTSGPRTAIRRRGQRRPIPATFNLLPVTLLPNKHGLK